MDTARFAVEGGSSFELLNNSRIVFRQNMASAGDLLDVVGGRVRIQLRPNASQPQLRIFTPVAVVTALQPAVISVTVDEDDSVRIDVLEGEVRVQHKLLPRNEPTIVRAVDAILVQPDEQISRRVDRGSLYRYTVKPLHDFWTAVTPGHSHGGEPIEQNKFVAERMTPGADDRMPEDRQALTYRSEASQPLPLPFLPDGRNGYRWCVYC